MTNKSFYKGNVVKLTWQGNSRWEVVSVYYLDTNSDENIFTNFMHKSDTRVIVVPINIIKNFDADTTTKVNSSFDVESGIEHWNATQ